MGETAEDTAILAADLIRHLGYDAVLIIFSGTPQSPGHCAVGVKGDDSINGSYYNYNNNKYYYLETTGSGWELGEMPDDYQGVKANIYPMIPVPILSHNWTTKVKGSTLELKVTIQNLGSPMEKMSMFMPVSMLGIINVGTIKNPLYLIWMLTVYDCNLISNSTIR